MQNFGSAITSNTVCSIYFFLGEMIQKQRETHSETDRQTERQMGIRSRGREMEIQTGGGREKQREAKVERHTDTWG